MAKWMSPRPEKCDLCDEPLGEGDFLDGKTPMGPWAIACMECANEFGMDTGLGKGQLYDGKTLEKKEG